MKALFVLLILLPLAALAATVGQTGAYRAAAADQGRPVAGGGGGGGSGAPAVLTSSTNQGTGISSLTTNLTVSGANTLMMWFEDWYDVGATPNTPTWNGSSTGVTFLTNGNWHADGNAKMRVYYLASPASGTHAAATSFSENVDEVNLIVVVLTNAAGTFEISTTNFLLVGVGNANYITNICPSAATDLNIMYGQFADSPWAATIGPTQTKVQESWPGSGTHTATVTRKAGQSGNSTNWMGWDIGSTEAARGAIGIGVKGFP